MRIQDISAEHIRELFRLIRDVGLVILAILGPVATVWAIYIHLKVWAFVMALGLALLVTFVFYFWKRIRRVPYLKEGGEAGREAAKLLKATRDTLYYYGGVGFIGEVREWHEEYDRKLAGKTTIKRFLNVKSGEDMTKMLEVVLGSDAKNATKAYKDWVRTHCNHLRKRATHNDFHHFEGAPIWRYGLHCIVFDEKHVVIPFASGETSSAIFIRNCPEMAKGLRLCLDGLIGDFNLDRMTSEQLTAKAGLRRVRGGKDEI